MIRVVAFAIICVAVATSAASLCNGQPVPAPQPLKNPELVLAKEGMHTLWLQYTPPRYDIESNKFIGYFRQGKTVFRAESPTGLNGTWTNSAAVTGGPQTIVKRGDDYFSLDHEWRLDEGWYHHHPLRSTDGLAFSKLDAPVIKSGEDFTLLVREEQKDFYCYIRPRPPHHHNKDIRKIGLTTSTDFKTWSEIRIVLAPNEKDHPAQQFYSMSVVYDKKRKNYWGFLNVFQVKHDDGPPYPTMTGEDNAVRVQLCSSRDGVKWKRCYNQKNFIEPPPGIYEQFAIASIREMKDCVDLYVVQSRNRHNVPGDDFQSIVRYTLSLEELSKYED